MVGNAVELASIVPSLSSMRLLLQVRLPKLIYNLPLLQSSHGVSMRAQSAWQCTHISSQYFFSSSISAF